MRGSYDGLAARAPLKQTRAVGRSAGFRLIVLGMTLAEPTLARADEGGVSFWLPGLFGSFAAAPGAPGLSIATFYYHPFVTAGGNKTFLQGGRFEAGIQGRGDLVGLGPTWILATPVLGGQASVSLLGVGGRNWASIDATLTGPRGNEISGTKSQALTSVGDLFPQATLKWNQGVNNYMVYGTGDIRSATTIPPASPTLASGTERSMAASATRISTPLTGSNSRRWLE